MGTPQPLILGVPPPLPVVDSPKLPQTQKGDGATSLLWAFWVWSLLDYIQLVALTGGVSADVPEDYFSFVSWFAWSNLWWPTFDLTSSAKAVPSGTSFTRGAHNFEDFFLSNLVVFFLLAAIVVFLLVAILAFSVAFKKVDVNKSTFGEGVVDCLICALLRLCMFSFTGLGTSALLELSQGRRAFVTSLAAITLVAILMFAVGSVVVLVRKRASLHTDTQTAMRLGGLYLHLSPRVYWFQAVVLLKKSLMIAFVAALPHSSVTTAQIALLVSVLVAYLGSVLVLRPFLSMLQHALECGVTLLTIFHLALLFSFTPATTVRREDGSNNAVTWLGISVEIFTMALYVAAIGLNAFSWAASQYRITPSLVERTVNGTPDGKGPDGKFPEAQPMIGGTSNAGTPEGAKAAQDPRWSTAVADTTTKPKRLTFATSTKDGDGDGATLLSPMPRSEELTRRSDDESFSSDVPSDASPPGPLPRRREVPKLNLQAVSSLPPEVAETERKRAVLAECEGVCSRVAAGVYVGGSVVAADRDTLQQHGITHVVNCVAAQIPCHFTEDFKYLSYDLADAGSEDLDCILYPTIEFIEEALAQGGRVFIHCLVGSSRSVAVSIAWLVHTEGLAVDAALARIKEERAVAAPNLGFYCQLVDWRMRRLKEEGAPPPPRLYRVEAQSKSLPDSILVGRVRSASALQDRGAHDVFVLHATATAGLTLMGDQATAAAKEAAARLSAALRRFEGVDQWAEGSADALRAYL